MLKISDSFCFLIFGFHNKKFCLQRKIFSTPINSALERFYGTWKYNLRHKDLKKKSIHIMKLLHAFYYFILRIHHISRCILKKSDIPICLEGWIYSGKFSTRKKYLYNILRNIRHWLSYKNCQNNDSNWCLGKKI